MRNGYVNMQSRHKYSVTTNQTLHSFFRHQFKHFGDECQLPSRFKLSVQNVH